MSYLVVIASSIVIIGSYSAFAETSRVDDLKNDISSREEEIKKLEEEIADYQRRLVSVGNQKRTLQNAIAELDLSRAKLAKDIQLTQKLIDRASFVIGDLDTSIRQKERKINEYRKLIAEIVQRIDHADRESLLEVLLGHESISTFFEEVEDLNRMQATIRDGIKSLERLRNELSSSKDKHRSEQARLFALEDRLDDQRYIADQKRKEQYALLTATKNQEANYRRELALREERKKQFEREIEIFEAQLAAEIDPNSFPAPGTKVLAYPLDQVFVTQKFGKTSDARRLYESGTHNGIDFRAAPGTPVRAANDGIVVETGDTDKICPGASYGKWILIEHRNGLSTLYAHLDLIKVVKQREVRAGELIGYSGSSGYATGPHLHFTVFVTSALKVADIPSKACKGAVFHMPVAPANGYLDPEDYL